MRLSRLWVAATIIAGVVFIGFVLSVPHTRDIDKGAPAEDAAPSAPRISLRDSFKKGVHTITGAVETPNACTAVAAQASLSGDASNPSGILIEVTFPSDSGVCLQVPTSVKFSTTISAPAGLPLIATVNGKTATTTAP